MKKALLAGIAIISIGGGVWFASRIRDLPPASIAPPKVIAEVPTPVVPIVGNPLAGKKLRYLIGTDVYTGKDNEIVEVSYDSAAHPKGAVIKYGNLFDEKNSGKYGPYLKGDDVSSQYHEGRINPKGPGWTRNVNDQLRRAKGNNYTFIEWDNPDSYTTGDIVPVLEASREMGIGVVAKNAGLMKSACPYIGHKNVFGLIVEKGAGQPESMDALRRSCGKPNLPVWFVAFGDGYSWAATVAKLLRPNMYVTFSTQGEYGSSVDLPGAPLTAPARGRGRGSR